MKQQFKQASEKTNLIDGTCLQIPAFKEFPQVHQPA
jgi:hypothetical protein